MAFQSLQFSDKPFVTFGASIACCYKIDIVEYRSFVVRRYFYQVIKDVSFIPTVYSL